MPIQRQLHYCLVAMLVVTGVALAAKAAEKGIYLNAQLPWHEAVLDAQGRVLAWYQPEKNLGYDHYVRLDWDFLEHRIPIDKITGVKVFLTASMYDGKTLQGTNLQHNPAGTFAHQTDGLIRWYPYSGDQDAIDVVRLMLDYQMAHGTTPANWEWARVPFATSCLHEKEYGGCLRDMPMDFRSGIETDKVGELGLGYIQFYELTGERKYLEAGIQCATQLAKHVRTGDVRHTPWPFRLDARTGATLAGEEFGGMIVAPVRLFDELIRIGQGDVASYKTARDKAWNWLVNNPLNALSPAWDKWSGYHEDIPKDTVNVNTETAMMTAFYILDHDDPASVDPSWKEHVGYLLDRSRVLLGLGPFFGAWAINEQLRPDGALMSEAYLQEQKMRDMRVRDPDIADIDGMEIDSQSRSGGALLHTSSRGCCSRAGLVCSTSQWGAINAMYFDKTRDGQSREDAFRSLNYATYFAESDGRINAAGGDFEPGKYWFEDGYGDAGRSFMWAMSAVPEFAPIGENHLLGSKSVVQKVSYGSSRIDYQTFDKSGTEILRLNFRPDRIVAGDSPLGVQEMLKDDSYTVTELPGGDYAVRVRHVRSNRISITKR